MAYIEQTLSEAFNREKEENETLKSKIFVMNQSLIKKNNIIYILKKKKEDRDNSSDIEYDRDIYVLDPSKAIVQINDELLMYKEIYDSLMTNIKETRESLLKSELMISDLQKDNTKLRLQFQYHMLTANREKETLINAIQYERSSSNNRQLTDNCSKQIMAQLNTNNNICKTDIAMNNLQVYKKQKLKSIDQTKFENEDFVEILKNNNINQSEYEKLSKTKTTSRLTEVIEMMYCLIKDKNMSLNLLKEEIEKLTTKNFQLNKDNMLLFQQKIEFKNHLANEKRLFTFKKNKSNYSDSLSNNTSQITQNNNITNAISTYHKFIKFEEKKVTEIYTDSFEREHSSQHDSIVYMKNIREYSNDVNENTTTASKDKKTIDNNFKDNNNPSKNIMTIESITSSEFREGFKDIHSFISTIRENKSDGDHHSNVNAEEKETDFQMVNIKSNDL